MSKLTRRRLLSATGLAALPPGWTARPVSASGTGGAGEPLPWYNWSGALRCQPKGRFVPAKETELVEFLASSSGLIRPLGSGHSFSPLVPTAGHLVVIDRLTGLLNYNATTGEATFAAGTRLGDVGPALAALGRALHNLPDIDRQSVAGAISTATHGTGLTLGCLSDYVTHLRLVTPTGEVRDLTGAVHRDLFDAARVSLGALGVITQITFATRESYRLRAQNGVMATEEALDGLLEQAGKHRHYELFPFVHSDYSLTLAIDETDAAIDNPPESPEQANAFSELLAQIERLPIAARKAAIDPVVSQIPPSERVDESYRILANVRNDRFNEMEYSVELEAGPACVREVLATIEAQQVDVGFPLEVRTVKADDTWLSMSQGQSNHVSISIHRQAARDHRPYFSLIEPIFWKYGGRPHWGKVHSLDAAALKKLYPRFADFQTLQQTLDPTGRMLNAHLRTLLGAVETAHARPAAKPA